jgi:cytochrome c553
MAAQVFADGLDIAEPIEKIRTETVYYNIVATKFRLHFIDDSGVSGPFQFMDKDHLLFVSRCGSVTFAQITDKGIIALKKDELPNRSQVFCANEDVNKGLTDKLPNKLTYGVKNMKLDTRRNRLFVSTHSIVDNECLVLKVYMYLVDAKSMEIGSATEIYSSSKYIPGYINDTNKGCPGIVRMTSTAAGGAFALDEENGIIYFSVGDFGDGLGPQINESSYGKILSYDGKQVSLYATGNRNPQGLYFYRRTKSIVATDHGPKGGDEINMISEGDNLGWPASSYGIAYEHNGRTHFSLNEKHLGHHEFGKKPLFVYFPSIGISDITVIESDSIFKNWAGSVLVSSLRGNSIFRVLIDHSHSNFISRLLFDDYRGMYSEPIINLKERIRFLVQGPDGTLHAKADPDLFYTIQLDWPDVRRDDAKFRGSTTIKDKIDSCKLCHHPHKADDGIPDIYRLSRDEIILKLQDYASGNKVNDIMSGIAKSIDPEDFKEVADYYSAQH